jgi:hypothetical protein
MTATSNPANPPGHIEANTPCGCDGRCGTHAGPCRARHLQRHPATRALIHLQAVPGGPVCPYCDLAATRPGATAPATAAALNRPAAADQPDLFDTSPFETSGHATRRRGGKAAGR